jgi:hypothetical protein
MSTTELSTLGLALDRFLQEEIAIPAAARGSASTSQNYLRNVLRNKAANDAEFPELLARADSDFLGGSFARHTKIWPLDDIEPIHTFRWRRLDLHEQWISPSISNSCRFGNNPTDFAEMESWSIRELLEGIGRISSRSSKNVSFVKS